MIYHKNSLYLIYCEGEDYEIADLYFRKYDLSGTGIINKKRTQPLNLRLHQNYPNPFNPSTTISFDLPEASKINLDVYNVRGQKVWSYSQNNTEFSAGKHSVVWQGTNISGSSLPSGMYFIKFRAGNFTANQKIILIK